MSWLPDGIDSSNSVAFTQFRCNCCNRKQVTCGSPPTDPCVCSPGPRKGAANKGRVRR